MIEVETDGTWRRCAVTYGTKREKQRPEVGKHQRYNGEGRDSPRLRPLPGQRGSEAFDVRTKVMEGTMPSCLERNLLDELSLPR